MIWERNDPSLICVFGAPSRPEDGRAPARHVMILLHAGPNSRAFTIPAAMRSIPWRQFLDTAAAPPHDIYPNLDGPEPHGMGIIELEGRSLVCFVSGPESPAV
jgi:glycogen operon protein